MSRWTTSLREAKLSRRESLSSSSWLRCTNWLWLVWIGEREGRNPKTGEKMEISATVVPAFSAGKVFKNKVVPAKIESETPKSKVN